MSAPTTSVPTDDLVDSDGRGGYGAHADGDGTRPSRRWPAIKLPALTPAMIINLLVVVGVTVFVFSQLQPHLLFRNTTPSGGDMGAHVWQPAYMRDHLLPHFRLTGWTSDWYAGFPAMVFYFPLPSLAIVVLSVILPYSIACSRIDSSSRQESRRCLCSKRAASTAAISPPSAASDGRRCTSARRGLSTRCSTSGPGVIASC